MYTLHDISSHNKTIANEAWDYNEYHFAASITSKNCSHPVAASPRPANCPTDKHFTFHAGCERDECSLEMNAVKLREPDKHANDPRRARIWLHRSWEKTTGGARAPINTYPSWVTASLKVPYRFLRTRNHWRTVIQTWTKMNPPFAIHLRWSISKQTGQIRWLRPGNKFLRSFAFFRDHFSYEQPWSPIFHNLVSSSTSPWFGCLEIVPISNREDTSTRCTRSTLCVKPYHPVIYKTPYRSRKSNHSNRRPSTQGFSPGSRG